MPRIIYLNPFTSGEISGGIKTCHRHVELLVELGFDAHVWQPRGRPRWFRSTAPVIEDYDLAAVPDDDFVVFPEVLHADDVWKSVLFTPRGTRIMFCQNQFYALNRVVPEMSYAELGFRHVMCCSVAAKRLLETVLGVAEARIIPCFVDRSLFVPRAKRLQIAMMPRKLPLKASFIARAFRAKYPELAGVGLVAIEELAEEGVARVLGESAFLLSLSHREAFGLVPVEAMSAGCLVAGFHGYGGLEYATPDNGFWFSSDEELEVVDALARLVKGYLARAPWVDRMRENGYAVAERYSRENTRAALDAFFTGIGAAKTRRP